jgi:sugar lactone lactonase YvrE
MAGSVFWLARQLRHGRWPRVRAEFANLHVGCFALSSDGLLYVTDSLTWIRRISPSGTVTTLADNSGLKLEFRGARGIVRDASGNLYVADSVERCIIESREREPFQIGGFRRTGKPEWACSDSEFPGTDRTRCGPERCRLRAGLPR